MHRVATIHKSGLSSTADYESSTDAISSFVHAERDGDFLVAILFEEILGEMEVMLRFVNTEIV